MYTSPGKARSKQETSGELENLAGNSEKLLASGQRSRSMCANWTWFTQYSIHIWPASETGSVNGCAFEKRGLRVACPFLRIQTTGAFRHHSPDDRMIHVKGCTFLSQSTLLRKRDLRRECPLLHLHLVCTLFPSNQLKREKGSK